MKPNTDGKWNRGFTLVEMLAATAILVILLAVGSAAVVYYSRWLTITRLDNTAREIYLAAENRAVLLTSGGRLGKLLAEKGAQDLPAPAKAEGASLLAAGGDDGTPEEEYQFIRYAGGDGLGDLLPQGAIDPALLDGSFYLVYETVSGSVTDVFYADAEDNMDPAAGFADFYKSWRGASRATRINAGKKFGYYGSVAAQSDSSSQIYTPIIQVYNEESLRVEVTYSIPAGVKADLEVQLSYQGKTIVLKPEWGNSATLPSGSKDVHVSTWILDTLDPGGPRFWQLFGDSSASYGGHFTVQAKVTRGGVSSSAAHPGDNSLFAAGSDGGTAYIENLRHLQNLDPQSSHVSGKTDAVQTADIDCAKPEYPADYAFVPIDNPALRTYCGSSAGGDGAGVSAHVIKNLTVTADSAKGRPGAGLFANGDGKSFTDVRMVNTTVSGGALSAGALAGSAKGASFRGCWVYWEPEPGAANLRSLLGSDGNLKYPAGISGFYAGGLVGELEDTLKLEDCLAATLVSGVTAGGLAGHAWEGDGGLTISSSYADCYLMGSQDAAGLIGSISGDGVTLNNVYTAGFITAQTGSGAAGLCRGAAKVNANGVYTVMRLLSAGETKLEPAAADISGTYFYLVPDETIGLDPDHARSYRQMTGKDLGFDFLSQMGPGFARKPLNESHPYNLRTELPLDQYDFPGLAPLPHYGDWGAQFQEASLAYYEQYDRSGDTGNSNEYGFQGGRVNNLRDDAPIILDGYAVAMPAEELKGGIVTITYTYQTGPGAAAEKTVAYPTGELLPVCELKSDGIQDVWEPVYYLAPLPEELVLNSYAARDFYQYLSFRLEGEEARVYAFNPHFAGTAVAQGGNVDPEDFDMSAEAGGLTATLRTPRHLRMLSAHPEYYHSAHVFRFSQELDLNYDTYAGYGGRFDGSVPQAPIGSYGEAFNGIYNGGSHAVKGVDFQIPAGSSRVYAGLFGYSTGSLYNVVYLMDYAYQLRISMGSHANGLYIGGLVGGNAGSVDNCAVAGVNLVGASYGASIYVGGLAGQNQGSISRSAAELSELSTDNASYAHSYAGGLVGENLATGSITASYCVGRLTAKVDRNSTARICGFVGYNRGVITGSYAAMDLQSSGLDVETFGFAGVTQGSQSGTFYLNDGNFTYRDLAYNANNAPRRATPISYNDLTAESSPVAGMSMGAYPVEGIEGRDVYPYPSAVRDGEGRPVHYGQWPEQIDLGVMGVYYWEKLVIDGRASYNVSLLSADPNSDVKTIKKQSTLSTAHTDGGEVVDYGYGYYSQADSEVPVTLKAEGICYSENGGVGSVLTDGAPYEDASVNAALADLMQGWTFHSYHSYGLAAGGGGLYPEGGYTDPSHVTKEFTFNGNTVKAKDYTRQPNGTFTLTQAGTSVKFTLNPHFADALSVTLPDGTWKTAGGASTDAPGGTAGNPYEIRAISQLQNINWNIAMSGGSGGYVTGFSSATVVYNQNNGFYGGNQYGYLYLSHDTRYAGDGVSEAGRYNYSWTERYDYHWEQTHDIDGKGGIFRPIAAFKDNKPGKTGAAKDENNNSIESTILTAWFGGHYDGGDYTIKNIDIQAAEEANCVGLFGVTLDAELKNIILYSDSGTNTVTVTGRTSYNDYYSWYAAGGLVGLAGASKENTSAARTISNCTVAGYTIVDRTTRGNALSASGDVVSSSRTAVAYGGGAVGGLVGVCNLDLSNCTATTTIKLEHTRSSGNQYTPLRVGGLAGTCVASVTNCYTGGEVVNSSTAGRGNVYIGGLVGGASMRPMFVPYYSVTVSGGNVNIKDSYTTMKLPEKTNNPTANRGRLMNCYAVGGVGGNSSIFTVALDNSYVLERTDRSAAYDDVPETDSKVTPVSYRQLANLEKIKLGNREVGIYELLKGFSAVTATADGGYDVSGKYSYAPRTEPQLQGLNYPFPTILTRENGAVHVHYGGWMLNGIERLNGGAPIELDLFTKTGPDAEDLDYGELYDLLLLNGVPEGGGWSVVDIGDDTVAEIGFENEKGTKEEIEGRGEVEVNRLHVKGLKEGVTSATVRYTGPDGAYHEMKLSVRVTAHLELLPANSPVYLFTKDTTQVVLYPVGRDGRPMDLAAKGIELNPQDFQDGIGYSPLMEVSSLAQDEDSGELVLELSSGSEPGSGTLSITLPFTCSGEEFPPAVSSIGIQIIKPEVGPGEALFAIPVREGASEEEAAKEKITVEVESARAIEPEAAAGDAVDVDSEDSSRIILTGFQDTETVLVEAEIKLLDYQGVPIGGTHTVRVAVPAPEPELEPDPGQQAARAAEGGPGPDAEPEPGANAVPDMEPGPVSALAVELELEQQAVWAVESGSVLDSVLESKANAVPDMIAGSWAVSAPEPEPGPDQRAAWAAGDGSVLDAAPEPRANAVPDVVPGSRTVSDPEAGFAPKAGAAPEAGLDTGTDLSPAQDSGTVLAPHPSRQAGIQGKRRAGKRVLARKQKKARRNSLWKGYGISFAGRMGRPF